MNINGFPPSPFSSLCLSWPLNAVSPMCAHCSLDDLAGSNTGDTALVSFVLHYSLPPCSCLCPFFLFTRPLLTTNFSANSESSVFFFFYVVEGCCQSWNSITYSESLPDVSFWSPTCWVGVACHRALVSPQWLTTLSRRLPTDRCWLTNQQLSTTNLCCRPSRLTAFCVTVIELNRW